MENKKIGIRISGETRIFKNEFNGRASYSTSISNKKEDNTYEKLYLSVNFAKCEAVEGDIDIKDGFLSFFKDKNGMPKVKLVVLDYTKGQQNDFMSVSMDETDLPF